MHAPAGWSAGRRVCGQAGWKAGFDLPQRVLAAVEAGRHSQAPLAPLCGASEGVPPGVVRVSVRVSVPLSDTATVSATDAASGAKRASGCSQEPRIQCGRSREASDRDQGSYRPCSGRQNGCLLRARSDALTSASDINSGVHRAQSLSHAVCCVRASCRKACKRFGRGSCGSGYFVASSLRFRAETSAS